MTHAELKPGYIALAVLSLLAIFPWPYGYYTFLRIAVCLGAVIAAYINFNDGKKDTVFWVCCAIAILFNPLIPVHLTRGIWSVFNVLSAGVFLFLAYKYPRTSSKNKE